MTKIQALKNLVGETIKKNKDETIIKDLGVILANCDDVEKEETELHNKHEALIKDYGELVIKVSSKGEPEPDTPQEETPQSLEDIVNAVANKK